MHIAVVGAGALGTILGGSLAWGGAEVTLVSRRRRMEGPLTLSRADTEARYVWPTPRRSTEVPKEADAIFLAVRWEHVTDSLVATLPDNLPTWVFTPLLPSTLRGLTTRLGARMCGAVTGAIGYVTPEGVRYWIPKRAETLLEPPEGREDLGREVLASLSRGQVHASLAPRAAQTNVATTVALAPLAHALALCGGIDPLLEDSTLLRLTLEACGEALVLGKSMGPLPAFLDWFVRFSSPLAVRVGMKLAKGRAHEAVQFVASHFGRKMRSQSRRMAPELLALVKDRAPHAAKLSQLLARAIEGDANGGGDSST